jgi:putative copper export protein
MVSLTSTYMIVFRFLHIVSAAFWFGASILFAAFLGPAAADVGP